MKNLKLLIDITTFQDSDVLLNVQDCPYPLRGILAEQVGMNGEVKRPQCSGDLAGAQGPHRVPPAKAVRKKKTVPWIIRHGIGIRFGVNLNLWIPLPSPQRCAVHHSRSCPPRPRSCRRRRCHRRYIFIGVCGSHVTRPITQREGRHVTDPLPFGSVIPVGNESFPLNFLPLFPGWTFTLQVCFRGCFSGTTESPLTERPEPNGRTIARTFT